MQIPVIHLDRVFHVGTMDAARVGANGPSQEGRCLSVSLCPEAWTRIARLGGNAWHELDRPDGAFLDAHAVLDDPGLLEAAVDWAVDEGLAERRTVWRCWRHDDESGEWGYMTLPSEAAAFEEAGGEDVYDEPCQVEGPDGRAGIEPATAVVGLPALEALTGVRTGPGRKAEDAVLLAWGRAVASDAVPGGLDGVWWREAYDPDILSAPRAGIFPDRVAGWAARGIRPRSVDDEEALDAMPDAVAHELPGVPAPR